MCIRDRYCTVPLNVPFTALEILPALKLAVPSVTVVALTLVSPLTELASPTVIVLLLTVVVVSLDVPANSNVSVPTRTTSSDPLSAPTVKDVAIAAVPAAVKRPCASTVNVGIAVVPPYDPALTAVLSRFNVTVSVAPTTDDIPVPPAISSVSPPATVWFEPK